jgi:hypothetical protein
MRVEYGDEEVRHDEGEWSQADEEEPKEEAARNTAAGDNEIGPAELEELEGFEPIIIVGGQAHVVDARLPPSSKCGSELPASGVAGDGLETAPAAELGRAIVCDANGVGACDAARRTMIHTT